jgi:hypothetical protein
MLKPPTKDRGAWVAGMWRGEIGISARLDEMTTTSDDETTYTTPRLDH